MLRKWMNMLGVAMAAVIAAFTFVVPMQVQAEEVWVHTHTYRWDIEVEPTDSTDGEMVYRCSTCGEVKYRLPISAYGKFMVDTEKAVEKTAGGSTVVIDAVPDRMKRDNEGWMSLHRSVYDLISARPDVTAVIDYRYKGDDYEITIPGGSDFSDL